MAIPSTALTAAHDVTDFDCGVPALNRFFGQNARQGKAKGLSQTFVVENPDKPEKVWAFGTLGIRKLVPKEDLPLALAKRLPREVTAITLARLAVDLRAQGQGLGELLLADLMRRAYEAASQVGGWALFVDAKDENAAAFYRKYGFIPLPSNPLTLFYTFAEMAELME